MPEAARKIRVQCEVNGRVMQFETYPMARLLDVLREQVDAALVNSCLVPALQAQGAKIRTIEGVASGALLHAVQQAFLTHGGAQCGICTPGMILATVNLLGRHPQPDESEIREGLAGNLCRCTGYTKIFESVLAAIRAAEPSR